MRQLQLHRTQRGSANWPFILSLLLLLVFVYLWFSQRDDLEAAQQAAEKASAERQTYQQVAQEVARYASDLSGLVGWNTKIAGDVIPNAPAPVRSAASTLPGVQDYYFTDLEPLRAQLEPDGTTGGGNQPGLFNYLINQAQLQIQAEVRRATTEGVVEKAVDFESLSDELKDALREISQMEVPVPPVPPRDPDDEDAARKYEQDLADYEAKRAEWEAKVSALQEIEGYEQIRETITTLGGLDLDRMQPVLLEMFDQAPTGKITIADLVTFPPPIIENFKNEFRSNKSEDQAVISNLQTEVQTKNGEIADLQQQLASEQDRHAADVAQLQGEVQQANEAVESNRREATTALNDLSREREERQTVTTQKDSTINALEERIRIDKEKRDLEIRRDDPDGRILASSPMMQTAVIDLGSSAKVYPGLRFRVSRIGRGGIRETVGEVQVISATGPNSAKVAVVGLANPRSPIVRGDIISNPFFKATAPIYLYLAGELDRYPREVLLTKLKKLNVVVDDKPSGRTDYIVVPNSMAAPAEQAAGGEDEEMDEGEGTTGAKTEFERIQSLARTLGAQVITERMLNEFLGL